MPIRIFLKITSLVTFIIGAAFLFLPVTIVNLFLIDPIGSGDIFIRFLGSSLIGYSCLNYYTSRYKNLDILIANMTGNFVTLFIASVLSVIGLLDGSLNKNGVLILILHLVFGSGFGYYIYRLKSL
jgi:hypothetical protein